MFTRWLKGVLIFALGCVGAMLIRPAETNAAFSREEVVEGTFKYINGDDFRLVYPQGEAQYLVVLERKAGKARSAPWISTQTGQAVFSKKDLERLTVYRLEPQIVLKSGEEDDDVLRCARWSDQCPLPPPPPPDASVMFLRAGPLLPVRHFQ